MTAIRSSARANGHGRRQQLVRFFHDQAAEVRATTAMPLALRYLTKAVSVSARSGEADALDDPSSFTLAGAFSEEEEYDPSGRVEPSPLVETASVRATNTESPAVDAEPAQPDQLTPPPEASVAPDASADAREPRDPPDGKLAELDGDDEDGNEFLQRLKAITEQPEPAPVEPPPAPPAENVAQSRHAIFDQLTPLLQRAQTFDLGTHRVDRRRLDAIAASVLAEEEEKERSDSGVPAPELAARAPAGTEQVLEAPAGGEEPSADADEELELEPNELRKAIAEIPSGKRAAAEEDAPTTGGVPNVAAAEPGDGASDVAEPPADGRVREEEAR